MATLEEVVAALRIATDKAADAVAPLVSAQELAADAAALIRSAGQGSAGLDAEIEQTVDQFTLVTTGVPQLLNLLNAAQQAISDIVSALTGTDRAVSPGSPAVTLAPASMVSPAVPSAARPQLSWAEQQRPNLPGYITSGIYVDQDGHCDMVQSGSEPNGEHERINAFLIEQELVIIPDGAFATVSMHIEMKVAWRMREGGARRVEVVINRVVCGGPMSCEELLEDVLLPGQELTVHDPVRVAGVSREGCTVTYTLDVWYHHDGGRPGPQPVRTESELETLLTYLLTHEQPHPAQITGQGLPTVGRRHRPDRLFKLDVSRHEQVGALLYMGPGPAADTSIGKVTAGPERRPDVISAGPASGHVAVAEVKVGAWVTRTVEPIENAPTLYIDKATQAAFPQDAALPLDLVRQALLEFQETGQRPTCVDWQHTSVV